MGWVKTQVRETNDIFNDIISKIPKWNGMIGDSSSPYEYWSDFIRDNYDVTLKQCDELCSRIKAHYNIEKFYYND